MIHEMRLNDSPFQKIRSGLKTAEYRLFDDKRKLVKVGDTMIFSNRLNKSAKITVQVTKITSFNSFSDMAKIYPDAKGTEQYYSVQEVKQLGVVAIEFKIINERIQHHKV